jgi:hypothetical protein
MRQLEIGKISAASYCNCAHLVLNNLVQPQNQGTAYKDVQSMVESRHTISAHRKDLKTHSNEPPWIMHSIFELAACFLGTQ